MIQPSLRNALNYHTLFIPVSTSSSAASVRQCSAIDNLAHGALIHSVCEDFAPLCEEDAGRFCGGAVGD